ncbi:outer membrane protein assembly factor BamE [Luteimonas aestuarii]|uniref:Outer membrane protein assembly factor BamE n=1 Tax=Luteimonas aestuarii TaxID=453837 RepID=A0A4R5U4S3_9GAMM|nr:OmpA family protein [Luteimonas aestuarii]TDK28772.1 outer membrane protein assembly factor BamE [Luteimonas aestuarii]
MRVSKIVATAVLCTTTALLLAACGTRHVSRDITPDGRAGEIVFPDVSRIVLKEGTFPNVDSLRTVGSGVTKDQLYYLLGRPHFREALYGVREWDYLFHFRTPEGIVTCQYKVIFDTAHRGQSFHWAPASCADMLAKQAPAAVAAPAAETRIELSADALFAFAKSGRGDILDNGRQQLAAIADRLLTARDVQVRVIGHTDRIGSDAANQALSQRRAETVRQFFIDRGISASSITAEGRGEFQPVTTGCSDALARQALVQCLQPDRRVELFVRGIESE